MMQHLGLDFAPREVDAIFDTIANGSDMVSVDAVLGYSGGQPRPTAPPAESEAASPASPVASVQVPAAAPTSAAYVSPVAPAAPVAAPVPANAVRVRCVAGNNIILGGNMTMF